jgi:hypothetical protein
MAKEQTEAEEQTETEAPPKRARKSHRDRAVGNLKGAKRLQREVSEDGERAQLLLAEANVLALLDLADAIRGPQPEADAED